MIRPVGSQVPSTGNWIYVSPANHGEENRGCDGFDETAEARKTAEWVSHLLVINGYDTVTGSGDFETNYAESNRGVPTPPGDPRSGTPFDVHIPIHSNAAPVAPYQDGNVGRGWKCTGDAPPGGTLLFYNKRGGARTTQSTALADAILQRLIRPPAENTPGSPGTPDETRGAGFLELKTSALSAYVERGFHTHRLDKDWMQTYVVEIGAAIAIGVMDFCQRPGNWRGEAGLPDSRC